MPSSFCFNTFSRFVFILSLFKHFHVYAQKLIDGISLDLASYEYFQTIQLLKDYNVWTADNRPKFFDTHIKGCKFLT